MEDLTVRVLTSRSMLSTNKPGAIFRAYQQACLIWSATGNLMVTEKSLFFLYTFLHIFL